jgi:hypothetical protein
MRPPERDPHCKHLNMISVGGAPKSRGTGCLVVMGFGAGFVLVGIGSAIISYLGIHLTWRGCTDQLGVGGRAAINFLGVAALLVMPAVALVFGLIAGTVHVWLGRSPTRSDLATPVAALIAAACAATMVALIILWVVEGNPSAGACKPPPP